MIAGGTEAAGTAVDLATAPATIVCPGSRVRGDVTGLLASCPRYASTGAHISGGDEMVLASVSYVARPSTAV